jgi:uncharacterized protein
MELIFEWDSRKDAANARKHGISFEEAKSIFDDPFELMRGDPDHSAEELRSVSIGESDAGRLVLVVYVQVENVIRVISARMAESDEVTAYRERRGD